MSAVALHRIAEQLSSCELQDAHEQGSIFEELRELRAHGEGELGDEVLRRLEAVGMLVGYLARMGEFAGEEVRVIAVRLLRDAAECLALPRGERRRAVAGSAVDLLGDVMLGQILLKRGQILDGHIHEALKVQRAEGLRFGEALVKIRACTQAQVTEALASQAAERRVRGAVDRHARRRAEPLGTGLRIVGEVMLGELLIQRNVVTRRQLERALEVQKQEGLRVGEALVKVGATTMEQIEQALRIQSRDRRFGLRGQG
jgi:hypothetical protein